MSITVNVYTNNGEYINIAEETIPFEPVESSKNRPSLWGAAVMRELGLELLPGLAQKQLAVDGTDLVSLEIEVKTILNYINLIAQETSYSVAEIEQYCHQILRAISTARSVNGGVIIG